MLEQPLTLPCGAVVPNRLCKAAMTEGLAHPDGSASEELARLYGVWSDGGSGILLSGNIQVDGDHLERPGNVVVDNELSETAFNALAEMATQGTRAGNHLWAQISHAGRQTQKLVQPLSQSTLGGPPAFTAKSVWRTSRAHRRRNRADHQSLRALRCGLSKSRLYGCSISRGARLSTAHNFSVHSPINAMISGGVALKIGHAHY